MTKENLILFILFILLLIVLNLVIKSIKKENFQTQTQPAKNINLDDIDKLPYCFDKKEKEFLTDYSPEGDNIKCSILNEAGEFTEDKIRKFYYEDQGKGGLSNCIISCANCEECKSVVTAVENDRKVCAFLNKSTPLGYNENTTMYVMKECDKTCKRKGDAEDLPLCHNSNNCDGFPFTNYKECSPDLDPDIPDIHVQRQNYDRIYKDIHFVNPFNPCCLRTCINDFTYTTEEEASAVSKNVGDYKSNIPIDMLFSSKCAQCLTKFEPSLKMLKNPDVCENTG